MSKRRFVPQGSWVNITETIINENSICFGQNSKLATYQPFDYFFTSVDYHIVKEILIKTRQPFPIHVLFASLDPNDDSQLLRWCKHFGLPTYSDIEVMINTYCGGCFKGEAIQYLEITRFELKKYKLAMQISALLATPKTSSDDILNIFDDIFDVLGEVREYGNDPTLEFFTCDKCYSSCSSQRCPYCGASISYLQQTIEIRIDNDFYSSDDLQNWVQEDLYSPMQLLLDQIINANLDGISPIVERANNSFDIRWKFDSLLSAFYLMLAMDIAATHIPILCQNPRCSNFFIPYCESASYCSPECQNRAKQQRHRKKVKQKLDDSNVDQKQKNNLKE